MRMLAFLIALDLSGATAAVALAQTASPSPSPSWSTSEAPETNATTDGRGSRCREAAGSWMAGLTKNFTVQQAAHFTAVMVNEYGDPCRFFNDRDYLVAGDPIVAAVYRTDDTAGASVGIANCAAETAVSLQANGDLFQPQKGTEVGPWEESARRVCHGGGTVDVVSTVLSRGASAPTVKKTTFNEYARYRATLQLGVTYSENHAVTFGLRKDGDQNRIFRQTATQKGPEYVGILNVYAVPRYFQHQPWGGLYKGRDVVHDHGLSDRLGLVIGAGLSKPSERFLVGASLEVFPGVSLIGAREWVKTKELVGLVDGAAFAEAADKIPTDDVWHKGWVVGASFDLLYAVKLFGKKP